MNEFKNKIAVVTGAASGIGFAVCSILSQRGALVYGIDRSDNCTEWEKKIKNGIFLKRDVADEENWEEYLSFTQFP